MLRNTGKCSVGFAAVTSGGAGRLLSAAHCDSTGNVAWTDGNGDPLTNGGADVSVQGPTLDSMRMDPVGGTAGWVHGGPWNATSSTSRYHLKVAATGVNSVGDLICTSGMNTGENCNAQVIAVGVQRACPTPFNASQCTYDELQSFGSFYAIIAKGDSGGPVYRPRSDGRVNASNIISGAPMDATVNCPSSMAYPGNTCFYQARVTPIRPVLTHWDLTIETTP